MSFYGMRFFWIDAECTLALRQASFIMVKYYRKSISGSL